MVLLPFRSRTYCVDAPLSLSLADRLELSGVRKPAGVLSSVARSFRCGLPLQSVHDSFGALFGGRGLDDVRSSDARCPLARAGAASLRRAALFRAGRHVVDRTQSFRNLGFVYLTIKSAPCIKHGALYVGADGTHDCSARLVPSYSDIRISSILMADCAIGVPGPKMAAAPSR